MQQYDELKQDTGRTRSGHVEETKNAQKGLKNVIDAALEKNCDISKGAWNQAYRANPTAPGRN